jgi:regulation of enolase protein 1 (concanavalin A-like superfamily)
MSSSLSLPKEPAVAPIPDGTVLCQGFDSLSWKRSEDPYSLHWYCAPDAWNTTEDSTREGRDGSWELIGPSDSSQSSDKKLRIHAPAKKDFWRKTFYDPIMIKDDGPVAYVTLQSQQWYTLSTSFTLTAMHQFDQAGLYIRINSGHWIKAGIEVVDHLPRLSAVVTNVYSDWSTQAWPEYTAAEYDSTKMTVVSCHIRIHCRGNSFVVEAKQSYNIDWEFVRIAHLSAGVVHPSDPIQKTATFEGPSPPMGKMWAGVFAACPEDQQGSFVDFHDFCVSAGSSFDHNADGTT